jgi:hypothetical protein
MSNIRDKTYTSIELNGIQYHTSHESFKQVHSEVFDTVKDSVYRNIGRKIYYETMELTYRANWGYYNS